MTDIFSLNEAASAAVPVDLPGGGKLSVLGTGNEVVRPLWRKYKEIEKAQLIRSAASQDIMGLISASDKVTDQLAKVAVSWEGITSNGSPLDVSPENAVLICGANGPFKRKMLNALAESEERFLGIDET